MRALFIRRSRTKDLVPNGAGLTSHAIQSGSPPCCRAPPAHACFWCTPVSGVCLRRMPALPLPTYRMAEKRNTLHPPAGHPARRPAARKRGRREDRRPPAWPVERTPLSSPAAVQPGRQRRAPAGTRASAHANAAENSGLVRKWSLALVTRKLGVT